MSELELTSLLREHASAHAVPGAALGLLREGAVSTAYSGIADTTTGEPVTSDTRFAVGSLAKSMVATVVARLAETGLLTLDDPVAEHVPELRDTGWGKRATVRDLLANRSRVPLRAEFEFSEAEGEVDDVLSRFASKVAQGEPRAGFWSYTNAGWCLLGRAIETATGLAWEDAMRANLFAPLAMDQTTFTTGPIAEPRSAGHDVTADGPVRIEPWTPRALAPAGTTLLSTVNDMLRFANSHLEDPSLAMLRAPHAGTRIHAWLDAWCLGWAQFDWRGGPVWGWDGVISGQRAVLRIMPERRGAVVLLANGSTGRALYRSLFSDLMETCFDIGVPALKLEPSPSAGGDLSRFAGVYAWPDRRWTVTAADAGLRMEGDGRTVEALPVDDCTFVVDADDPDTPTVTFGAVEGRGRPRVLYQALWGLPRMDESVRS
jgi:CubicO group peptidase (beta-lactamase class C family)